MSSLRIEPSFFFTSGLTTVPLSVDTLIDLHTRQWLEHWHGTPEFIGLSLSQDKILRDL